MAKAVAEAFQIIEVRTKVQLLTLEAEAAYVIPFSSKDAQTICKPIKGVEDEASPSQWFDQFGQGVAISAQAVELR